MSSQHWGAETDKVKEKHLNPAVGLPRASKLTVNLGGFEVSELRRKRENAVRSLGN
jgi:hypothetical protein